MERTFENIVEEGGWSRTSNWCCFFISQNYVFWPTYDKYVK